MPFFQVDDDFWSNRKVVAMIDEEGFARASQALTLWTLAGSRGQKGGYDGVVTLAQGARLTTDRAATKRAAALLVKHGLWHAPGHECAKCPQPPDDAWVFHDWYQFGYATGEAVRVKNEKAKELRNAAIVEAVWRRDTHPDGHPRCRYCSRKVVRPSRTKGGDRRSREIGQLDHIDPTRAIGPSNIVVACPDCNQHKAQRSPEQASMTLLPPPADQSPINPEINPAINPGSIHEVSPTRARGGAGAGGVRAGSELGNGGVLAGQGAGGAAPLIPVASADGSPWHNHHGPPPSEDLIHEATCAVHQQPMPCGKCLREAQR